jgi:hypothetical protein
VRARRCGRYGAAAAGGERRGGRGGGRGLVDLVDGGRRRGGGDAESSPCLLRQVVEDADLRPGVSGLQHLEQRRVLRLQLLGDLQHRRRDLLDVGVRLRERRERAAELLLLGARVVDAEPRS